MAALPDYLQKTQLPRLSDRATEGMGSSMPPHVSIRGNAFTLVDQSGEEHEVETKHLDVAIIDMAEIMSKLYYGGKEWTADSKDPPVCWSSNGIGPSKESVNPQAATCQQCEWNVRGSAISKLTKAPIKACRDEKWLAVLVDGYKDMIFQLRITPGSFQNWKSYAEKFNKQPFDLRDVTTRMQFEKDKNGVLTFQPSNWLTPDMVQLRNKLVTSKATDGIVGRLDQPIAGTAAIVQQGRLGLTDQHTANAEHNLQNPAAEPIKPDGNMTPKTRGRPKKTETASEATNLPNGGPAMAPFRPEAAPTFGIETPQAPPAEMANDLDSFFKS